MSSVDNRIVEMQFNNKQFIQGASESEKSLTNLEQVLARAAKTTGLSTMGAAVGEVSKQFSAMKVAGLAAIATIASKVTAFGLNMAKSLTIAPVMAGFHNYEERINAVQTILANTQAAGVKLPQVTAALGKLNEYANKTVYNFSEMAKNIGTFTAAGVDLNSSVNAIKGIANLAALSGSNSQQASTAMYQLSQALAAGQVHLQDWNSVVNAGMGGTVFQRALTNTAVAMGKLNSSAVKLTGPMKNVSINGAAFRQSLTPPPGGTSWLTSDVLTKTLSQFTGDLSKAQIMAQGFNAAQAEAIMKQAKLANNAATQIKTSSQMFQALKEEVASAWSNIFSTLFGNINQAKAFFTPLHQELQNILTGPINGLNKILEHWAKFGGRDNFIDAMKNSFEAIGHVMHSLKGAWEEVFPPGNGDGLIELTYNFLKLTMALQPSKKTLRELKNIFAGVFAAIHIVLTITGVFRQVFIGMLEGIFKSSGHANFGILKFLAGIGKFLVHLDKAINQGGKFNQMLRDFGKNAGELARHGVDIAVGIIGGLLKGLDMSNIQSKIENFATKIVDWIKNALGIHSPATELVPVGQNIAEGIAVGLLNGIKAIGHAMGKLIQGVFAGFNNLFGGMDALDWASVFNAILTGGLLLALKKGVDATTSFKEVLGSVKGIFDETGNSLKAWQKSLKAKMLLEIAIAVGILAVSLIALSFVNPKKLAVALGAITIMMGDLVGALYGLSKTQSDKQVAVLAASIAIIAAAMIALAIAVTILGQQDPKKVATGIGEMAAVLAILMGAMLGFTKMKGSVEGFAGSMLVMAIAMNVMATAVLAFGSMSLKTLAKGLGAMAIGLGLMIATMLGMDKMKSSPEGLASSILIMSAAMVVLSGAVVAFGNMDMKTLAKGFGAVAVGLGLMVGALLILSGNSAGVLAAAGAMAIMAGALNLMVGVILVLGAAPWQDVARGLGFVAVALGIFLLAAAGAELVAPGLEVLSGAILAIGAAMFLAGVGMAAFGTGFALLAATGTAGVAVITAAITAFIALLPNIAIQVAAAFVAFIQVIAAASGKLRTAFATIFKNIIGVISDNIPVLVKLIVKFVGSLLDGISALIPKVGHLTSVMISTILDVVRKAVPKFGNLINTLIKTGLDVITKAVPRYINAGVTIVTNVLQGLANKMPKMLDAAGNLIVAFIRGVGKQASKVADAAGQTILTFLKALDTSVQKYTPQIRQVGLDIAGHLIDGFTGGLAGKISGAVSSAIGNAGSIIKHFNPFGKLAAGGLLGDKANAPKPLTMAQITAAVKAASGIANAIIAGGNKSVLVAQQHARAVQNKAFSAQADAKLSKGDASQAAKKAQEAQRYANQHKKDKAAQQRAKAAAHRAQQQQNAADKAQKAADKKQAAADAAAQHVLDVQAFQEADLHGKGDIKNQQAEDLATKANNMLAKANAEAAKAKELMKTNKKAGQALLKQSQDDAAKAKALADEAKKASGEALDFYKQEVLARIKAMKDQALADQKAADDQAAYDAATTQGKADIMAARAVSDQAKSDKDKADAQNLIEQAKAIAGTDAAKAMDLLDQADALTQEAKDAADQAAQEKDQAQQLADQLKQEQKDNSTAPADGTTPTPVTPISPSQGVLADAAKAVDRYTASLQQATELAAAQAGTVQFVQNNYSPEALSASEIYRQNKNLLSTAKVKMGAPTK